MATPSSDGTERNTDRLEGFSDAVLAIAITLPVVELHAPKPDDGDLAAGYLKLAPEYGAYGLSVILIGCIGLTATLAASYCRRPIMDAAPSTWWFLRWLYATAKALPDSRLTDAYLSRVTVKYGLTAGAFWLAFALAFWNERVGLFVAALTSLVYVIPPASPTFKPGSAAGC